MHIRDAQPGDADAIAAIYNDAVLNSTAIWNDVAVDAADRVEWMATKERAGHPVLVAVDVDAVVGYAAYGPWRPQDGFRHTVEHSVYVRNDQRGRGIGRALMTGLLARARSAGVHVMVAAIDARNSGSLRLHEALGFRATGTVPQVGAKFGEWLDLTFMTVVLDDRPQPPR
ncbi:N-acetyltransferase family protein [Microbacterium marinum]|uniref:GNAT family N-acetyltransferase n=1 Tax=Microbacterium marinum TaxID=421115 RepID=UPI00384FCB7E